MNDTGTPDQLRAEAQEWDQRAAESWERSDTDGFLSQWASGLAASRLRLAAEIAENGGRWRFPALFDLAGNLVAAKLIETKFGLAWGVLESDDPRSKITKWVTAFPARPSTMQRKGYREGYVMARAKADYRGANATSVRAVAVRTDGGFSRDVTPVE